jgi:hypothetical protein
MKQLVGEQRVSVVGAVRRQDGGRLGRTQQAVLIFGEVPAESTWARVGVR